MGRWVARLPGLVYMLDMHVVVTKPLPGREAHLAMAAEHRSALIASGACPPKAVDAAVLALLLPPCAGEKRGNIFDWTVLLIRRNRYAGVHSGQIAFPGGKVEKGDGSFWETACREAFEEMGIARSDMECVTALTPIYVPASNHRVHPFVAVQTAATTYRPSPLEVADYKAIPLGAFNPSCSAIRFCEGGNTRTLQAPSWKCDEYVIWGATAMILSELHALAAAEGLMILC